MSRSSRLLRFIVAATILSGMVSVRATAQAKEKDEAHAELYVGSGPHAGTFNLSAYNIFCLSDAKRKTLGASYSVDGNRDPKVPTLGIVIDHLGAPGPIDATVSVMFGDTPTAQYFLHSVLLVDRKNTLTMDRKGKWVTLAFNGKTEGGVAVRLSISCGVNAF